MLKTMAKKIMNGFGPDQRKRLKQYVGDLSKDEDPKYVDKHMIRKLYQYAKDPIWMKQTIENLLTMGFNQSRYISQHMRDAISRFQSPEAPNYWYNATYRKVKTDLISWASKMQLQHLQYKSKEDIRRALPKKDTHAGFSALITGDYKKGAYLEDPSLLTKVKGFMADAVTNLSMNRPIILGTRTQASLISNGEGEYVDFKSKTRLVSMIDVMVIIIETIWAKPVQKLMSGLRWYAGGKSDGAIQGVLMQHRRHFNYTLTVDYSAYDQSIPSWLIRDCFDIVLAMFKKHDSFMLKLFHVMVNDFIHKVFIDVDGKLQEAHKGVPSGSMFTQIIDSLANYIMITTYMRTKGIAVGDYDMMIMGDDNIIFTREKLDHEDLARFLKNNFGITCHPEKCSHGRTSEDPEFLSRTWTRRGVYRDPIILVSKLIAPERRRTYSKSIFEGTYEEIVDIEIDLLLRAYALSFPLGMREITSHDGYSRRMRNSTDLLARSRLTTGLVKYLAMVKAGLI